MGWISKRHNDKGAQLVDSLARPLLILLVLGIVEFGWLPARTTTCRMVCEGARAAR
jgi:hypothetical protein